MYKISGRSNAFQSKSPTSETIPFDDSIKVEIGDVNEKTLNAGIEANIDLKGYKHNIDKSALNHIINRHGETENYRNQIPVTKEDIKNIPDIIYNPMLVV